VVDIGQPGIKSVNLPNKKKTPCLEQVAFMRVMELCQLAILDYSEITRHQLCDIGRGPSIHQKQKFDQELRVLSQESMAPLNEEKNV
jgi:hypothetical protein